MTKRTDPLQAIQGIPWFLELKPEQITRLGDIAGVRCLEAGETLFREGDREDFMYIILEGQINLEVLVPSHGTIFLYTGNPLDILGWSSMTPVVRQRTATAHARSAAKLLAFDSNALRRLCDEDPCLGYVIMRRLANVVASQLLVTQLVLYDLIMKNTQDSVTQPPATSR